MLFVGNVLGLGLPSASAWAIGGLVMGLVSGAITGRRLDRVLDSEPYGSDAPVTMAPGC